VFFVQGIEKLISSAPVFKRHEGRVELIFIELNDRFWMEIDPIEIRPVSHRLSGKRRRLSALLKALLIWILLDCGLSLNHGRSIPMQKLSVLSKHISRLPLEAHQRPSEAAGSSISYKALIFLREPNPPLRS
jgi:hypothetical protein